MKIVVAMSGGVDSSATAALLLEQGHEVIGLSMKTFGPDSLPGSKTVEMKDASQIAKFLGIPFHLVDYREVFRKEILSPFVESYRRGLTPNPCIDCNKKIKFGLLLRKAKELGGEKIATGHYANIEVIGKEPVLTRGSDSKKDQSYFLYRLSQDQLGQIIFPLGKMTKLEVRNHARRLGLPVAEKADSQELCFIGPEGYAAALESLGGLVPMMGGDIVDKTGKILGHHQGIHHFTMGQRKGLGVSAPTPLFVTGIDAERQLVTVGPQDELLVQKASVSNVQWETKPPEPNECFLVQQRYRERPRSAKVTSFSPEKIEFEFVEPGIRGAPGQAAVFYRGDFVVGGGVLLK